MLYVNDLAEGRKKTFIVHVFVFAGIKHLVFISFTLSGLFRELKAWLFKDNDTEKNEFATSIEISNIVKH